MSLSRREIGLLLPAVAAAQSTTESPVQPSKAQRWEDLPVRNSATTKIRQMLNGTTHTGFLIDMHETELAVGEMPHAAHRHVHEEMVMLREGQLEVTIAGKTTKIGPGSYAYVASNEEHGWRNVGTTPAKYFVLALGRDK